jgi:hypothetical protein
MNNGHIDLDPINKSIMLLSESQQADRENSPGPDGHTRPAGEINRYAPMRNTLFGMVF